MARARLAAKLPPYCTFANPLDAWGSGDLAETYPACLEILAQEEAIDLIAVSQDVPPGMAKKQIAQYADVARAAAVARALGEESGTRGLLVAIACFYALFNSLEVVQTSRGIKTVRRLLGIPVGCIGLRRDDITKLEKKTTMQSQSGSKHVIYYNVCAVDGSGKQHDIALGFRGESQANAAMRLLAREFGLRIPEEEPPLADDEDPLGPAAGY